MNRRQLTSLTHCKKCGIPIEIQSHWEEVRCNNCGIVNNLKCNYGYDKNLMYYDNTEFINKLKTIGKKPKSTKKLNVNKKEILNILENIKLKNKAEELSTHHYVYVSQLDLRELRQQINGVIDCLKEIIEQI